MNKEKKKAMVPKLRFEEFQEAGVWEEKQLSQICEVNPSIKELPKTFVYVDLESVEAGILLQKKIIPLEGAPSRAQRLLKNGDIIFQTVRPYQKNNYFFQPKDKLDYVASTGYAQLRANQSNAYLFQYLHNDRFVDRVLEKCTGSNYPAINSSDLAGIIVEIPELPEQQKIAAFLTSIDDLITAQNEKIKALQVHKKGLMQQLLPAEGETVPRVRFREFEGLGEWEEKRIEDLAIRGSGHTPNRSQPNYYNGGVKWVSLADSNRLDKGYIYETKAEISVEGLKNSSAVLHPSGTVIVSRDAGVGKSAVLFSEMAVSQHFIAWHCDKSKLSNWFLYFFLQVIKPKIERIASGSTIKTIGLPYFKGICITIPSIYEQQKIAACLSSLDDLITAQSQKLEALKAQKKGLMQRLFPNTYETDV
ncbi:MAG: restriction endonuclease subunit S [Saprospiraceae bacterium]|nr:restriction endonuclease subunit S [Saprospiraceae bacterium]